MENKHKNVLLAKVPLYSAILVGLMGVVFTWSQFQQVGTGFKPNSGSVLGVAAAKVIVKQGAKVKVNIPVATNWKKIEICQQKKNKLGVLKFVNCRSLVAKVKGTQKQINVTIPKNYPVGSAFVIVRERINLILSQPIAKIAVVVQKSTSSSKSSSSIGGGGGSGGSGGGGGSSSGGSSATSTSGSGSSSSSNSSSSGSSSPSSPTPTPESGIMLVPH